MDHTLINAHAELRRLRKQLHEVQSRINEVEGFIRMYQKFSGGAVSVPVGEPQGGLSQFAAASKRHQIMGAVRVILADGKPRSTRQILEEMKAMGVEIGGSDELANLSAYLSREKTDFQASRKFGWTLFQVVQKAEPSGALTPEGSKSNDIFS